MAHLQKATTGQISMAFCAIIKSLHDILWLLNSFLKSTLNIIQAVEMGEVAAQIKYFR